MALFCLPLPTGFDLALGDRRRSGHLGLQHPGDCGEEGNAVRGLLRPVRVHLLLFPQIQAQKEGEDKGGR